MKVEVKQGKEPIVDFVLKHFETDEVAYFFISTNVKNISVEGFGGSDEYTSILFTSEEWYDERVLFMETDSEIKFFGAKLLTYLPRKNGIDIVALKTEKSEAEAEVVYEHAV